MDVESGKKVLTMTEYIEREATIERLKKNLYASNPGSFSYLCYQDAINSVQEIPPADVAPVRHGRWERTAEGAALCTACKRKMNPSQYGYAFCSLCGAKMDGGAD